MMENHFKGPQDLYGPKKGKLVSITVARKFKHSIYISNYGCNSFFKKY